MHSNQYIDPMQEQRRHKRFSVDSMDIRGKILFSNTIKIINISVGGVAFITDKRLNLGGIYVLRLESKGTILHIQGTIMWSRLNKNNTEEGDIRRTYSAGMKFIDHSATRRKSIEEFIKNNFTDYQKTEMVPSVISGIRIHVRFHIHPPDKAIIDCAEQYKVKRLSQGGMLIESDNSMYVEDTMAMQMTLSENKAIAFWGRIVTCQEIQDTDPPRYEVGIEFKDMSEKDSATLKAFISSLEAKAVV